MSSTVVIVPTYNEAENLPVLAGRLLALDPSVDVLCVDDASPDETGAVADGIAASDSRFHMTHREGPRGYARASVDGLAWALARDYRYVTTMDADLSHDPADVPRIVAAVESGADLAIGSRYVDGGELAVDWGPLRRVVSRSGSAYARLMLGSKVQDCTSGFRCYRAEMLRGLPLKGLRSEGYSFLIETLALMHAKGSKVVEVPIRYVDRRMGTSKISRAIVVEALCVTTMLGVRRLLRLDRRVRAGA